jgi:hypothetical protein
VLIFNSYLLPMNNTIQWTEETLLDLTDERISMIKDSRIVSISIKNINSKRQVKAFINQLLLVGLDNYYDDNTVLLKIDIIDKKVDNIAFINFQKHVRIICAYDMDVDGFLDILYIDDKNNVKLYILTL